MTIKHYALPIGGELMETGAALDVYDKYRGRVIATVAVADRRTVDLAVAAASRAFETIRLSPYERFSILKRTSELLLREKKALAELITAETGKPIADSLTEVERTAQTVEISAEEAKRIHGEGVPVESAPGAENRMAFTIRVPIGVVCAITPFNVPLNLAAHKIAPALAAGNAVVVKPASATPLSAIRLAQLMEEAGLPKGLLNVVVGSGETVGSWLAQDPRIGLYTFTGSPEVGRRLKQDTGLRNVLLELGSNSAVIVHEDADLELAADLCAAKSFANAGQVCISVQRIYVHDRVWEPFVGLLAEKTKALIAGDPYDASTQVGPMISEKEAIRAERWIKEAESAGATIECGGIRNGSVLQPTILTGVDDAMKVVCEEIFAPVVGLMKYRDLDGCIAAVNRSRYGLQAGIFTRNAEAAFRAARELRVGGVIINDASQFRADQMPYGGVKESGWGKEGPKYAIREMTEERIVVWNLGT
ncbi:aldehyde dehydrogenase family protein [Cohnella lubricantis]|uniref:Aldehyde dehydrogenase family protein n=1 Tax=Cohnella lubricantis TaxID=2163172 RepID=A0A841TEC0_9BACL|nr:aldehyde dehydrogenase family protein [Cohnella lubricantis]MBB6678405.1 aldehyde dehydrogenase family protein [Cohnella lubricantis]MBP2116785.1 acyl-CoA reductase-like NAD-dependent aldehyde dehydrogenase [Cohnella lubricantis]